MTILNNVQLEAMHRLSHGVLKACEAEHRILLGRHMMEATIIGAAAVIAALVPKRSTPDDIALIADRAGEFLSRQIRQGATPRVSQ